MMILIYGLPCPSHQGKLQRSEARTACEACLADHGTHGRIAHRGDSRQSANCREDEVAAEAIAAGAGGEGEVSEAQATMAALDRQTQNRLP